MTSDRKVIFDPRCHQNQARGLHPHMKVLALLLPSENLARVSPAYILSMACAKDPRNVSRGGARDWPPELLLRLSWGPDRDSS